MCEVNLGIGGLLGFIRIVGRCRLVGFDNGRVVVDDGFVSCKRYYKHYRRDCQYAENQQQQCRMVTQKTRKFVWLGVCVGTHFLPPNDCFWFGDVAIVDRNAVVYTRNGNSFCLRLPMCAYAPSVTAQQQRTADKHAMFRHGNLQVDILSVDVNTALYKRRITAKNVYVCNFL